MLVVLMIGVLGLIPLYAAVHPFQRGPSSLVSTQPAKDSHPSNPPPGNVSPGQATTPAATAVAQATPVTGLTPQATSVPLGNGSRFAVLLLGYGGSGHDGPYLTDSIMVVVVDPVGKTLTLLSLPRDIWTPILFDGQTPVYNKLNTAYAFAEDSSLFPNRLPRYTGDNGAGNLAMDTVSRLIGVPVRYYVGLDFQGFRDMIDAVGGVEVNVPDGFSARYPINDNPSINAGWTIVRFTPGPQQMNGERAIEYARARETLDNPSEGTDFARARRQRLIMEAFKNRVMQPSGLIHLPQVLSIATQHVQTDYPIPMATSLASLIVGWNKVQIYQTALTANNYLEEGTGTDGSYLLTPNTDDHSWAQIRAFGQRLWTNPVLGVALASTKVVVVNRSGSPGLGDQVSASLIKLGYQVDPALNGTAVSQSVMIDRTGGQADPVVNQLKQDLGLPSLSVGDPSTTDSIAVDDPAQLVLELGADATVLNLVVPTDLQAPVSAVGVEKFGVWPYVLPTPTPDLTIQPTVVVPEPNGATTQPLETALPTPAPPPVPVHATPITVPGNPSVIVVPSLVGLPEADAQRIIQESDLMTTYVNYQTADQVANQAIFNATAPGAVLSQNPEPGRKVPRGTRIALAVRKP
ncbi:MAG TPA: LCP family protein [Chloroflexota bacterium]|nr:LCP family protein [Chloroflexota bacterium]